jgi:hypothetical protein
MEKSVAQVWRDLFHNWPRGFARKGVVISSSQEQVPFVDFVANDEVLILERPTPDAVGGRRVALPFARMELLKFTEPLKTQELLAVGFRSPAVAKPNPTAATPRASSAAAPTPPPATVG